MVVVKWSSFSPYSPKFESRRNLEFYSVKLCEKTKRKEKRDRVWRIKSTIIRFISFVGFYRSLNYVRNVLQFRWKMWPRLTTTRTIFKRFGKMKRRQKIIQKRTKKGKTEEKTERLKSRNSQFWDKLKLETANPLFS